MTDEHEEQWRGRFADLDAYRRQVAELVADRSLKRLASVHCGVCGRGRRGHGAVVDTPRGLLLVTRHPVESWVDGAAVVPSERAAHGMPPARGRPVGWLLDGDTYGSRFGWRPPDEDDVPHLTCPRHGPLAVDPGSVVRSVRSGVRAVGVPPRG